ncbi:acetyltransferas-like protein [Lophiostoma macrostomum CBS 122681]|uniref:Acetyltransferas-like protein n=1 Tax=Lophiostoma macrostomum CBS 122681 TaxID=1314788 RepID=A0A6A6T4C0_9PLEO|nr:acetyltransferas-like protein [Lophiostoma macrostomum CBS 122681]
MSVPDCSSESVIATPILRDLTSLPAEKRQPLCKQVGKIERKTFPSSEAFDFDTELKKKNTNMILAFKNADLGELSGYLVYVRMKRLVLLHKICVVQQERGKGVGKDLIHSLRRQLENQGGCQNIQLWVDEDRGPAKALYKSCGFEQIDRCVDYYGPGRNGLKMQLSIGK